jgi:hypothetical protein
MQQASDTAWLPVFGGRKSDLHGVAFYDGIVNIAVLLAIRWVRNSNVLGIAGENPLWSFDAHFNSVADCERAADGHYRVPRFGSKSYVIPVLFDRSAIVEILCPSDQGGRQQTGHENDKAAHASKYITAVSSVLKGYRQPLCGSDLSRFKILMNAEIRI